MSDQPKKQELPPVGFLGEYQPFTEFRIIAAAEKEAVAKAAALHTQLLAALSDNEAKDARIAELECTKHEWALQINAQSDKEVQLLARIEKLEDRITISCGRQESFKRRAQSAEAKLKSVEGLLEEKYKFACFSHSLTRDGPHDLSYLCAEVDALLARIREAVKGDK